MSESYGMKRKTIKSALRNKIDGWINSIKEEELRELCRRDVVVTGGCIPSMLLGEEVNDYDIYFKTYETTKKVAEYYIKEFKENLERKGKDSPPIEIEETQDIHGEDRIRVVVKSAGVEEDESPAHEAEHDSQIFNDPEEAVDKHEETQQALYTDSSKKNEVRPVFVSTNAISLSNNIQIVLRFFGEPEDIHKNYDFVHYTNYWTSEDNELYLRPEALEALLSKTLVYQGSRYPLCSLFRIRKFIRRGWRINAGQILKIALQISELDLYDYQTLEEQSVGVDLSYFAEVLEACKSATDSNGKIDSAYLVEVIDSMFGE